MTFSQQGVFSPEKAHLKTMHQISKFKQQLWRKFRIPSNWCKVIFHLANNNRLLVTHPILFSSVTIRCKVLLGKPFRFNISNSLLTFLSISWLLVIYSVSLSNCFISSFCETKNTFRKFLWKQLWHKNVQFSLWYF